MELSRIDRSAPASILRTAWWAWWPVVISCCIGAVRLSSYVLSNYFQGDGDDAPVGVWATIFDLGRVAVGASTAVALVFVIILAARTRTSTVVALAIVGLSILFTLFIFVADYMAWMVSAKGLFAFTPRMLTLDYAYLGLTLVILAAGHFVSGYLGSMVYAAALIVTGTVLAVAARRWRAIERIADS
ncbi:MAG: hypothetical protein ACKOT0_06470 [bacterium]